ncbi:MAG: SDR family oxidoreductase [Roseitalea sp.]|jgi:NAD(P)-dependent dehydrogenase (short-subunit alcohol dehydrogenase family)|uniref:SDR family oxidoreductase n=1 Tax=Oceaniradius stylonematis TaxID=2184161 RepID=A0A3A8AJX3_9HYPH|nr:SDR family NAD(P)-dependent oxidoreductase [Oceaniradius stylonematis]MBO6554295.1 SDR family oxidoreductase [Roseitalea sp.]MBO6953339.1 SDR family oxidoreductase [Rhizobiaceae bacterium]MCR9194141.1 SDR family oxidoreductase [Hyphomonas sp.]MBO6593686.1 SDR family oxidoreductase [Roseitalea sp.]MBO6601082.1 SDR family oxidoreductase [Roseitalea sp.]
MRLAGRRAIITGGGAGIGAAITQRLADEGCAVAIADRDVANAQSIADKILASEGKAVVVETDMADPASVGSLIERVEDAFGGIDILVNNAGIVHPQDGSIDDTSQTAWDSTLDINLKGVFLACQAAVPALEASGGAIVNVASIVGLLGSYPSQIAYTASKGGVISITREMGVALARRNIRVNAVAPGLTATAMSEQLVDDTAAWELRRLHIPMGRMATPGDVAAAVAFLASDDARYITAHVLPVDGGMVNAYLTPPD